MAVSMDALPAIFPVEYRMVGGDVIFAAAADSKLTLALAGRVVGFEVDRIDEGQGTGWTVLVVGVVHELSPRAWPGPGRPWLAGKGRTMVARISPEILSGRMLDGQN